MSQENSDLLRFKRALVASEARAAKLEKACEEFRDAVLYSRGCLENRGFLGDHTNAILDVYADTIGAALDYTKGGEDE